MQDREAILALSRRSVLAGALLLGGATTARAAIAPVVGPATPAPTDEARSIDAWANYNSRLIQRLNDAGGGSFDAAFSRALLDRVNVFRRKLALRPYVWHEGLAICARAHAGDMAARNYFAHAAPEGFTHLHRVALIARDLCGPTAENLAWRESPGGTSPDDIESLWELSPGHRHNLLRGDYGSAGYGVVRVGDSIYAAGVYADASIRLSSALPLWVNKESDLQQALADASPAIENLALTHPFQTPTWVTTPSRRMPVLQEGAWQVRPMRKTEDGRFAVVSGPLFFRE